MSMEPIRVFFLKLLVFAIPFQQWEPFNSPYANATFLAFFSYFICALFERRVWLFDNLKLLLLPILVMTAIMFVMTYKNYFAGSKIAYSEVRQMIMQLVFFVLVVNEVRRRPELENRLLEVFLLCMVFMSVSFLLNLGVEYKGGRLKLYEANSNAVGLWYVLGIFIVIKFLWEKHGSSIRRNLYIVLLPLFILVIALTGSRGSIILLFLGGMAFTLFLPVKLNIKLPYLFIGGFLLLLALLIVSQVDVVRERFLENDGTLGGRLPIWEATWDLILERPWWGAGASGYERHMLKYFRGDHAPHNIYLTVLAYSGVVGLVAFLVFFVLMGRAAKFCNSVVGNPFYVVIYCIYIAMFFKAGGFLTTFTLWFFLALIVASGDVARMVKHARTKNKINQYRYLIANQPEG